jgi:hypothetical protein
MKLYNPNNGATFDTKSDDELHNAVYFEMGWLEAPEPEPAPPGRVAEPVKYEPVKPEKPAAKKTTTKKTESTD